jgi:hypothetical protein
MYKYQGGGFIPGVPAGDLTDKQAQEYGVENSPLYQKEADKKTAKEVKDGRN